ncbi:MAG: B12-binding domain-containing radical SAM protein [Proteobacteria bacterium]|nr:B12-binding domain-containing radical SAM protein [Pseudomonadota bacterium]MBU4289071.1 B12-binding domain-containing radical SAM protein [Pseudomonadota bacterium]MBU4413906.1 B12-binding domain-containing radical SAM protein [Pseudomonadota bacterium]MCG2758112.1 B12-binding domain-containing radical SAM protein [Desulfobacteraceae bacterium]
MKVTLVYPGITICGSNSYGKGMDSSWISHGLCSISAYAKNKGYDINLIDLRQLRGWHHFRWMVNKEKPDIIGLSMMSVDYNPVMKCVEIIKEVNDKITVVVGGPHPTLMTDEVTQNEKIDYIILGEGEISFTELLRDIENGIKSKRIIRGIKPDLDRIPFVDRELFSGFEYPIASFLPPPFVTVIAGRGCIYNCRFCQPAERIIFGRKVRRRSVDNVIEELKILRANYNFGSLMIHDDCLAEDKAWVYEFCDKYLENGFSQPFVCQSRADIICKNEDMIHMMSKAGLKMLLIGFESGNQRVLNFLRKGVKLEQNYEAARICRKHRIRIWANYMLGIPTETKEEVMDTVRMIKNIKPDHYSPAFYTPHPGSDLFKYVEEHGLSLIKSHDSYRRNATEAKIKGIDYKFLYQALMESMGMDTPIMRNNLFLLLQRKLMPFFLRHPHIKDVVKESLIVFGLLKK